MYKGFEIPFKLSISLLRKKPWYNKASYLEIGQEINNGYVEAWEECISYLSKGRNILDANGIQKNWFPIVDADVFISHSHRDIDDVLEFVGFLKEEFGLRAFVDSNVWGYCRDIIDILDSKYSNTNDDEYNSESHDVISTAINTLLSTALNKQIAHCECFMFLRSRNSTPLKDITYSPWIYGELLTSKIIEKTIPQRVRMITKQFSINESKALGYDFAFSVPSDHLLKLSPRDIINWYDSVNIKLSNSLCDFVSKRTRFSEESLNELYELTCKIQ